MSVLVSFQGLFFFLFIYLWRQNTNLNKTNAATMVDQDLIVKVVSAVLFSGGFIYWKNWTFGYTLNKKNSDVLLESLSKTL